ncbi:unnamed protein product [Prorocentrum cordatum]|uniref:Glycerophosphocholine acyltransferase 1 n=1 Tax=Prorocentrum cordatum TaxID=2364126 RepID=A0ABN9WYU5_9DINO|nr:unnamed protein product [Polarella glacialis]
MIVSLWVVGLPSVLYLTTDFLSLWQVFPFLYILLDLLLLLAWALVDWDLAAQRASCKLQAGPAPSPCARARHARAAAWAAGEAEGAAAAEGRPGAAGPAAA